MKPFVTQAGQPGGTGAALVLLVLAPLVAEFLLGDFTLRQIGFILVFIPQYGGGALLVREAARRLGGGWPTILLFALAYALIEEGFTTQSLFNPNYAGERPLDFGYIPALATSLHWTLFVLTLHVAWNIGSSVAIAEALAGQGSSTPWLGRRGLVATAILYLLGCVLTTVISLTMYPFVASVTQFAATGLAIVVVMGTALVVARRHPGRSSGRPPRPWLIAVATLTFGRAFHFAFDHGLPTRAYPALTLTAMIAIALFAAVALVRWSRRDGWTARHTLAAAVGAVLVYGWLSIQKFAAGRTALGVATTGADLVGQVALLAAILGLAVLGAARLPPALRR